MYGANGEIITALQVFKECQRNQALAMLVE